MDKSRRRRSPNNAAGLASSNMHTLRSNLTHDVVYYIDENGAIPARDFIESCPTKVRAQIKAVAVAVAKAPPKRFSGGGYWEAMHGTMTGWFEIRSDGPGKSMHYRVFCLLDTEAKGSNLPLLVLVTGLVKAKGTTFTDKQYRKVRELGRDYFSQNPRRL